MQAFLALELSQASGCPMVVIPAGTDGNGVPFGLQVMGPRWPTSGSWPSPRRSPRSLADSSHRRASDRRNVSRGVCGGQRSGVAGRACGRGRES
jgi:hypothetical protein